MPDHRSFLKENDRWRGVDFWTLNDALDEEQMRFQLREMRRQGVAAVIARTYIGLRSDYPGRDFKAKLGTAVRCAKELGMKIGLQAAYMPEAVPGLPEKFTAGCVKETAPGVYTFSRTPYYIDMLDPEAVRSYLQYVYADVWAEFKSEFGKTIFTAWVDEPSYSSDGLPWNDCLVEEFRKMWHCEPEIAPLFHEMPGCGEMRFRYWNTVVRLLEKSYFRQMREFCHRLGLSVSGHLMGEGSFHANFARGAAMMPFYRWFDLPGIDVLTAEMYYRDSPLARKRDDMSFSRELYTTVLQGVSAAAQAGRKEVLCEMYGVTSENFSLRDQIHLFDHFAAFGVNCRSVHALFYSLRGRRKRAYPPHINYYQPYWEHYHLSSDRCALDSWFVSQGEPVCEVMVMLPWNTAATLYAKGEIGPSGIGKLKELEQKFLDVEKELAHSRTAFELGDEFLLADCGRVEKGRLVCGERAYRAVVLPWTEKLTGTTLELLSQFAAQGGKIFALGHTPCAEAETLSGTGELRRCLAEFRSVEIACDDASALLMRHMKTGRGEELLFLFNTDCGSGHKLSLPCPAAELKADGASGVPATEFGIAPGGALRLVLKPGAAVPPVSPAPVRCLELPDRWRCERHDPNVLLLEFCRFKREGEENFSQDMPVLAVHEILTGEGYSGSVTLRFEALCRGEFPHCRLVLEDPAEWRVLLNGTEVPSSPVGFFRAREFECIDLPPLRDGKNVFELSRRFSPLPKPAKGVTELFENITGVELEAPFLIGDFAVEALREATRCPGVVRLNRDFVLVPEPETAGSELTDAGFPFYAGSVTLTQEFEWDPSGPDGVLRLGHMNAAAVEVILNGAAQGVICEPPCRLPVKGLEKGKNILSLRLYGTLRNLLGPWHRPLGEYGECFGGYGFPNKNWIGAVDSSGNRFPDWYKDRSCDTTAWCESYMQVPFGVSDVALLQ